jgi:hypothetical protein
MAIVAQKKPTNSQATATTTLLRRLPLFIIRG